MNLEMGNVTDQYNQYGDNYSDYYYDEEPLYRLQDHVRTIIGSFLRGTQ